MGYIFRSTLFSKKNRNAGNSSEKGITQFQALSTALAASMGTGNIIGVAAAITAGGPGAVFWMWVSSLFGMATAYAENYLGVKYKTERVRKTDAGKTAGEQTGSGPMLYLERGLKSRPAALVFAAACVLASFGIGNAAQSNAISSASEILGVNPLIAGIIATLAVGFIIIGGSKKTAKAAEMIIPFISLFYMAGALFVIYRAGAAEVLNAFKLIFSSALGIRQVSGGLLGAFIKNSVTVGLKRGIFSNEAGMGSSVLVHTDAECDSPDVMGMWAVAEVCIDTIVCCSLTALVIICSKTPLSAGAEGISLVISAFEGGMGAVAGKFIAVAVIIFAFATILGWSYYGVRSMAFLTGRGKAGTVYKIAFSAAVFFGAVADLSLVWEISDLLNAFMLIPNLFGILLLSSQVEFDPEHQPVSVKKMGIETK